MLFQLHISSRDFATGFPSRAHQYYLLVVCPVRPTDIPYLLSFHQSLSGHTSAVESVTFDAAEVLVVAGAASGTIKLWDLEEAKSKFLSLDWRKIVVC